MIGPDLLIQFAEKMITIRLVEEKLLNLFSKGLLHGTVHTYMGQEANAAGIIANLNPDYDIVISNHRNHGHYICMIGDIAPFFAELLGRKGALCGGYGGSQHLHSGNFFSFGVLGGTSAIACGIAMAIKLDKQPEPIVVLFLGDGALGEGLIYESLNLASLWSLPVLFVVENNGIAQTTMLRKHMAGEINKRFEAFGIPAAKIISTDVEEIHAVSRTEINLVRSTRQSRALIIETVRLGPHSKGDDTRSKSLLDQNNLKDPLLNLQHKMGERYQSLFENTRRTIDEIVEQVLACESIQNLRTEK